MTDDEATQQKEISGYAAMAGAWIATRMEFDRALLTLAGGGIGLLATFLTRESSAPSTCGQLILYAIGTFGFAVTVVAQLWTFARNTRPLEDAIRGGSGDDHGLKVLAWAAAVAFVIGAVTTIILAFTIATTKEEEVEMDPKTRLENTSASPREERLGLQGVGKALNPGRPGSTAPASTAPAAAQEPVAQQPAAEAPAAAPAAPTPAERPAAATE